MIFAGGFMQVLVNHVLDAAGWPTLPWKKGDDWQGADMGERIKMAVRAYAMKPGWIKPTEPFLATPSAVIDEDHPSDRWVTLHRIERHGKLVHISRTRKNALREIAWRDWILGCDGVAIVELRRKGATMYGTTSHPHRYGSAWPQAKMQEFAKLYQSGMSMRELEEHFDTAASTLGYKRAELGLRKRR